MNLIHARHDEYALVLYVPRPYRHQWTYTAKGDKTEVILDLDYDVPGKALGRIADRLIVERLEEKAMEHTIENLKVLCEAPVPQATAR